MVGRRNMPVWCFKLFKFLVAGLPSFVIALPLNILLVEKLHLPKPVGYMVVLCMQVTVNFFVCRRFVFDPHPEKTLFQQFGHFFSGIIFFRIADWVLYSLLTSYFGLNYVAVQLANIFIFAILKFEFSKRVMEPEKNC